jgi:hypothetical protein
VIDRKACTPIPGCIATTERLLDCETSANVSFSHPYVIVKVDKRLFKQELGWALEVPVIRFRTPYTQSENWREEKYLVSYVEVGFHI